MGEIKDFNCTYDNSAGINGEVTEGLGLTFPDAYLHADTMAKLSRALKEHDGAAFCELPFCHTVEAEAMGGLVNYGNDKRMLREQGEHVVLQVSGPFTILNVLIDARYVFKAMRKQPEVMKEVFWKLGNEVLRFMEEAKKYGVDLISYADSSDPALSQNHICASGNRTRETEGSSDRDRDPLWRSLHSDDGQGKVRGPDVHQKRGI